MTNLEPFYVVGAGGIGCALGYALGVAGARVMFVESNPRKLDWGQAHGVRVDARPPLKAEFQLFSDWKPTPSSTVILCTKCYDNAAILERLPPGAMLIPVQNGFDALLERFGHSCEGIASFVSECQNDQTHTRITRPGHLHLGGRGGRAALEATESAHARIRQIGALLTRASIFDVRIVQDVLPYKHAKLMYNAAIGPLAAMAGLDNGRLLSWPRARLVFFALLRENYAILRHAGKPLGKIGPFHPATVDAILRRRTIARSLAWAFYPSLRGTYCSMNGDLPTGRTEIDNYTGYLLELAGNFPCPINTSVYRVFKRMESERIAPSPKALDALEQALALTSNKQGP